MPFSRIKRSEEERSISTVTVVVACVLEKGRICQILHALHSVATMASFGLGHVKRVKRQNQKWLVILHPRKALSFPTPDCVSDCQLAEAQVSAHAAVTREQFVVWSKIWPLTFHPIAGCNLQDPISPTLFEEAFKRDVISGRLQAALFDDQCNEVVSVSAANEPKRSFLGHPIMLLIEKMSERSRHSVSPSSQYLCTGLTLLVSLREAQGYQCTFRSKFTHSFLIGRFDSSCISGKNVLKSSVQRVIKSKAAEFFPGRQIEEAIASNATLHQIKCHDRISLYTTDAPELHEKALLFQIPDEDILPTLRLVHWFQDQSCPIHMKKVTIDAGAIKFILSGADVMAPGILVNEELRSLEAEEYVLIFGEQRNYALAIGKCVQSGEEAASARKGVAINVFHVIGDGLWRNC